MLMCEVCSPGKCQALYVTVVPGIVAVERGHSAILRWRLNEPVATYRILRVLNAHGEELVSSYFDVTHRAEHLDLPWRMELVLSVERTAVEVHFRDVQDSDDGLYTLSIAKAGDSGVNSIGRLLVYFSPEWRGSTRSVQAKPGEKNVTLNCSVAANPTASFTWEYIDPSSGRRRILIDQSQFSWHVLAEVTEEDFGVYTCTATNYVEGSNLAAKRQFVKSFNVTLEPRVEVKAADVAKIIVPIFFGIALILVLLCCIRQRCRQNCTPSSQRQKKTSKNEDQCQDEAGVLLNVLPLEIQVLNGVSDKENYAHVNSPLAYQLERHYAPLALKKVPPVTLPASEETTLLSDDLKEPSQTVSDTSLPVDSSTQPSAVEPTEPIYASARPKNLSQPVRTAPKPMVPANSLPPVRNAPLPPTSQAGSVSGSNSQQTRTLPPQNSSLPTAPSHTAHTIQNSRNGRKGKTYRPVNFTDPDSNDVFQQTVRSNNNLPECSRTGMLLNNSGSVSGLSDRRRSFSSSSDEETLMKDKLHGNISETGSQIAKHNNNNNLSAPDVIYADVMVHAPMGEDKIIGAKEEPSDYISIDFKRMRSK